MARLSNLLTRFRGFWNQFKRSKRGLVGLLILGIHIAIALSAPIIAPYDPLRPKWPGYYPGGEAPLAAEMCVPFWYKYFGGTYSENMEAISDYTFASQSALGKWNWTITNPELISITYNQNDGTLNDGCIEISYTREAGTVPITNSSIILNYHFIYPFEVTPKRFWIHTSYLINGTISPDVNVYLNFSFFREDKEPLANYTYPSYLIKSQDSLTIYEYPLIAYKFNSPITTWHHMWTRSTKSEIFENPLWYHAPEKKIFPKSGNYTFTLTILFNDRSEEEQEIKVYLDNLAIIIYGNSFGWLGTDNNPTSPRDIASSLLHGSRISISVGLLTAMISVSIGLTVGLIAGYTGGIVDELLMRFADLLIVLPTLPLLIVLAFILRPSIWNIILILSFMGWMTFSRNVRSMTLSLRERAFVEAAKVVGAGRFHILSKHILPNVFPLVYLALAMSVPGAIITEASLSFLGLFDPDIMSWGRMINEFNGSGVSVTKGFSEYWFWVLPPGIAISSLAISFILVGYALDEILNPKLRMRR
jgi:ABC-type dipeptide/oligopeptide/nickel transport system permease subunit